MTGAVKMGYVQVSRPGATAAAPAAGTATARAAPFGTAVLPVLAVDGGRVTIGGRVASVLGVPPQAFRAWTPPATAAAAGSWAGLAGGQVIADQAAAGRLGLTVLINAPGADLAALMRQVQDILGPGGTVRNLVPVVSAVTLPVDDNVPSVRPASWLDLYRESAAEYCPGLSWTMLAAIGEIESGDGANEGPSSAGALGPMQFMPSTWKIWGTDGFGQTGPPDIKNPLDAVPSAARMLCASGAASGGAALPAAIFGYNHADWYVSEVLALAGEYAREYS